MRTALGFIMIWFLGIELVDEECKKHLLPTDKSYFAPTPDWNDKRSHDRPWS